MPGFKAAGSLANHECDGLTFRQLIRSERSEAGGHKADNLSSQSIVQTLFFRFLSVEEERRIRSRLFGLSVCKCEHRWAKTPCDHTETIHKNRWSYRRAIRSANRHEARNGRIVFPKKRFKIEINAICVAHEDQWQALLSRIVTSVKSSMT